MNCRRFLKEKVSMSIDQSGRVRLPKSKFAWLGIFVAGGVAGILFLSGSGMLFDKSESLEYCISCHEMEQNVYQEYKQTIHYSNRTGVRVECADCHIPKSWYGRVYGKIAALHKLYHNILGDVDTSEKFEAKRLELAQTVWAEFEADGSKACKNCHSFEAMDSHRQSEDAKNAMTAAKEENMSCIDCHKGVAHKLPEGY